MTRVALGEFEHLTLLAIVRLGSGAYGAAIIDELEARVQRPVSHAATYVALKRLDEKGWVTSTLGVGSSSGGGRKRRYYVVTKTGLELLRESARVLFGMWEGLDALREGREAP